MEAIEGKSFEWPPGEFVVVGRQLWGMCDACARPVRVNKPILGSLHACRSDVAVDICKVRRELRQSLNP
jgi:hypothetical protein